MNIYPVKELTHFCNISVNRCSKIPESVIDYYDFTFVLQGEMTYIVNGEKVCMQKNDAIFLPPGTVRERETGTHPVAYASFNFHLADGFSFPFQHHMVDCINDNIRRLVHIFPGAHRKGVRYAQEKCTNLLNYILFELSDNVENSTESTHVNKLINYIDAHVFEKITLSELVSHIKLSKEYTCALFKKYTGKTITDFITERKLYIARNYIVNGEIPLSEIATLLHFDNYNYFSRRFKRQFGMTPILFKKNCK